MLELDAIDAGYGGFQALFGVSMQVNAGEAVAVIGANGAGKTTLLRVISGLLRPTSGGMVMEGRDLVKEVVPPKAFHWTKGFGAFADHVLQARPAAKRVVAIDYTLLHS